MYCTITTLRDTASYETPRGGRAQDESGHASLSTPRRPPPRTRPPPRRRHPGTAGTRRPGRSCWTRLGELHLVHALASVPVEEGLAAEHRGELLGDALHHLLHAGRVA